MSRLNPISDECPLVIDGAFVTCRFCGECAPIPTMPAKSVVRDELARQLLRDHAACWQRSLVLS